MLKKKRAVMFAMAVLIAVSGCTGGPPFKGKTTYYVEAKVVNDVAENKTILSFNNTTIEKTDALQKAVEAAIRSSDEGRVQVDEETYHDVREAFKRLPTYSKNREKCVYIRYKGRTVAVTHDMFLPGG